MWTPNSPPASGAVSLVTDRAGVRVLIIGATSVIAGETARAYAEEGARLFLTGRDPEKLASVRDDLRVRGAAQVNTALLDVAQISRHREAIDAAIGALGGLDVALIAHGILPDQARCQIDVADAIQALQINFTATVALLTELANYFERQQRGCIAVITSVAGDRGRKSNYVYGAAKGGTDRFLEGLRNRLHRSGVTVLTIKPGPVVTPMTAGMKKSPLYANPRRVGRAIRRAIERRRDVVYIPWFWRPFMAVVRSLPEPVFKRLNL
jgi:decaprenylphospho-beta-D-erythro-pentofuranosid-2-ulose 2-reductase